jgi:hypothetical protein
LPAEPLMQGAWEASEGGMPDHCNVLGCGRSWGELNAMHRTFRHGALRSEIAAGTVLIHRGPGFSGRIDHRCGKVTRRQHGCLQRRQRQREAYKNGEYDSER